MSTDVLNTTANEIIEDAYRKTGIVPARQAVKPYEMQRGLAVLNVIIKDWQAQGNHLWSQTEGFIPLITGQRKYSLGPGGDEITNDDELFATNLEVDQIATDTVLSVFDVSGVVLPSNIEPFSATVSVNGWTVINTGTIVSDGTILTLTNGAAVAGGTEYSLDTTVDQVYIVNFEYTLGSSAGATFTIDSGGTLDSTTLTSTGSGQLTFTANSDSATFRFENTSTTISEDSLVSDLFYFDTSTGSRIGVQLDDDTRQWANVIAKDSTTDPATLTIDTGLTSAATTANIVYAYVNQIPRPLRITQARYGAGVEDSEIPTEKWARAEYFDQPDKDSKGTVVQWHYNPQLGKGELYVWQVASSVNNVLRITYDRPLQISEEFADAPDIPEEWVNPLMWNLAMELGIERKIPDSRFAMIFERAKTSLDEALDFDMEDTYIVFQPDISGR